MDIYTQSPAAILPGSNIKKDTTITRLLINQNENGWTQHSTHKHTYAGNDDEANENVQCHLLETRQTVWV